MSNCLSCKHSCYDKDTDVYSCIVYMANIDILLDSEECRSYEKSEETES